MNDELEKTVCEAHRSNGTIVRDQGIQSIKDRVSAIRQILKKHPIPKDSDHLFICQDDDGGYQFPLADDTTIGYSKKNDLTIDSEYISGQHCRIKKTETGWVLEDLDSANGVQVNKEKISECYLNYGDIIQIADNCLIFFPKPLTNKEIT